MKTLEIFKKAGNILSEINEQYEYLSVTSENLNDLEIELLSANADFFAEHIKVLKKLNASAQSNTKDKEVSPPKVTSVNTVEIKEESGMPDTNSDPVEQDISQSYFSFQQSENEITTTEETEPEAQEEYELSPQDYEIMDSEPLAEIIAADTKAGKYEIADDASEAQMVTSETENIEVVSLTSNLKKPTLNELIAAQRSQSSIIEKVRQPVSNLKSIINLNDKLLFIKELFNGYNLAYSEAIEILNRFESFDAADNFLKTNYATKNNWASKQATADKFYELLNQRFTR